MNALLAQNWWAFTLRGIIGILFGLVAFFLPGAVMLSLALLFGIYLVVDGIFGIISAIRAARSHGRWGLLLVDGILNIIIGCDRFLVSRGGCSGIRLRNGGVGIADRRADAGVRF